jgi:hypothetical protein
VHAFGIPSPSRQPTSAYALSPQTTTLPHRPPGAAAPIFVVLFYMSALAALRGQTSGAACWQSSSAFLSTPRLSSLSPSLTPAPPPSQSSPLCLSSNPNPNSDSELPGRARFCSRDCELSGMIAIVSSHHSSLVSTLQDSLLKLVLTRPISFPRNPWRRRAHLVAAVDAVGRTYVWEHKTLRKGINRTTASFSITSPTSPPSQTSPR